MEKQKKMNNDKSEYYTEEDLKRMGYSDKFLPKTIAMMPPISMKTPIFTPVNKNLLKKTEDNEFQNRSIVIENFYSYNMKIMGPYLNMSQDFKIWAWLLKIRDQQKSNKIEMSIYDFAEILGHKRRSVNKALKMAIDNSLSRLMRQHIQWTKTGETKIQRANLLNYAEIDPLGDDNNIKVEFNPQFYSLYSDKFIYYMNLEFYDKIKGEIAKALWSFYESNSGFNQFKNSNIKIRLRLSSTEKEQNRQIKEAHETLKELQYLNNYEIKGRGEKQVIIIHRNPDFEKLTAPKIMEYEETMSIKLLNSDLFIEDFDIFDDENSELNKDFE